MAGNHPEVSAADLARFSVPLNQMSGARVHPALDYLRYFQGYNEGIFDFLTDAHVKIREKQAFPNWTFVPYMFAQYYVRERLPHQHRNNPAIADYLASAYTAMAAWRMTKGIYEFDPDIYEALINSQATGALPGEILKQLPEWAVFVRTPGLTFMKQPTYGYWAWLDPSTGPDNPDYLWMLFITPEAVQPHPLRLGKTLEESFQNQTLVEVEDAARIGLDENRQHELHTGSPPEDFAAIREELPKHLSLLLYICSYNADVVNKKLQDAKPRMPSPKKVKKGARMFASREPVTWHVGLRIGSELRRGREPSQPAADGVGSRTVRPHVRGAHWHLYWTGPKSKPQTPVLHWIPPTLVAFNPEGGEELPAVIHPVKE